MGFRLSKIYTRSGDKGTTALADGKRVAKHDPRVDGLGELDELNSFLGLLLCESIPEPCNGMFVKIQNRLFDLGAHLSMPNHLNLDDDAIIQLEQWIDQLNENLPPLKEFILPGGNKAASLCHVCRAVCRRAERQLWRLRSLDEPVDDAVLRYLNRLSDLLFVAARHLNLSAGQVEVLWQSSRISG